MPKSTKDSVNRRDFLRAAAAGTAALVVNPATASPASPEPHRNVAAPPLLKAVAADAPSSVEVLTVDRPGSDFMVDVLKTLDFEYLCANPGNSFRSLHESLINYGGNQKPEFITCCHEESAVAMGHGYAKIEGKPLLVCVHGTVGLQHASMAIYDAFCDRVPVYIILGNFSDAGLRFGQVELDTRRAGSRRYDSRLCEMGRQPALAPGVLRIRGPRIQNRDHAPDDARRARCRK